MMKTEADHRIKGTIGIYLHGDDLDPDCATRIIRRNPTSSWRNGDIVETTKGKKVKKKSGLWSYSIDRTGGDLHQGISEVVAILEGAEKPIGEIEGLAEARLGVFIGLVQASHQDVAISLSIDALTIKRLARHGVALFLEYSQTDS